MILPKVPFISQAIGKTNARGEVQIVAMSTAARHTLRANLNQRGRRDGRNKVIFLVVDFGPRPAKKVLIAKTEVQCEAMADLEIILNIKGQIALPQTDRSCWVRMASGIRSVEE